MNVGLPRFLGRARRPTVSLLAAATLWWAMPGGAVAHPYAASAFDAVTEGKDIYVQFRIDATSVVDLLNRTRTQTAELTRANIDVHGQTVSSYVVGHFSIHNDTDACPGRPDKRAHWDVQSDKVTVPVVYTCARDLDVVTIDSTLFDDEETPHQFLGTFRHHRAVENYLLSKGIRQAVIPVKRLAQVGPADAVRPGQFRMATPPPGAFDGVAPVRPAPAPPAPPPSSPPQTAVAKPLGSGFAAFFVEGVAHILGGLDHVLFVIALVSVVATATELAKVVTSFTLAHSLTLALGALDLVKVAPRLVEPLIAASIIYVALENVVRAQSRTRLAVTFGFGLVHGFGFSGVLRDLGLSNQRLVPALLGFNLGVEAGQLLIVAPLGPLVWWLRRRPDIYRRARIGTNAAVALVAAYWFVQRITAAG